MKAILNVAKCSGYSKYNGNTFDVVSIGPGRISLDVNNIETDFYFNKNEIEVIVIDLEKEIELAYIGNSKNYLHLLNYENCLNITKTIVKL